MPLERVTTGIDGLDPLLSGGLIRGRSYLVSGEPGTGKTTFCIQYILEGVRNGENGVFVTIDEKPEHLIADSEAIGWDLESPIKKGSLQLLDVTNYFSDVRTGEVAAIKIDRVARELEKFVKKNKARRLVIDPIAPLISNSDAISGVQEYIRKLIGTIEEATGCTTLLTSHVPSGGARLSQYEVEEYIVSGIFQLRLIKPERKYVRTLFVRKMRATATDLSEYSFDIIKGRGVVLRQPI